MCGISGIWNLNGAPVSRSSLERMIARLEHRGPDDSGIWIDGSVGFGHRRLAIIDLEGSAQPMTVDSGTICYNGEIFNYRDVRGDLQDRGVRFATRGDTELLLRSCLERGVRAGIEPLEGQFAFAFFDDTTRTLHLARDRMGVLPLHYYWDGNTFVFASEIKAVLAALPAPPELDRHSLKDYLSYGSTPFPDTLFEGIKKLPPGCHLTLHASGELEVTPYWSLPTEPPNDSWRDDDATRALDDALRASVRNRLVADVPVGAYLSGGVDSSLIVGIMAELSDKPVETFAAGFDDPRFDELPFARIVSEKFRTNHHEVVVAASDFEELWPRLTWHRDAPISQPADVAIFRLAEHARRHVKVLLSGEGSDELFAGYPKHRAIATTSRFMRLHGPSRRGLAKLAESLVPARLARARIALRAIQTSDEAGHFRAWFAPFTEREADRLASSEGRNGHRQIAARHRGDLLSRQLYFDCHTWLVDNLLERGDRMAMAASMEGRPPFMDHHVAELAFDIPSRMKVRGRSGKWLVKEVASRYLPREIVHRKKVGFRVPLDAWFRSSLREMARDELLRQDSFARANFDIRMVERLLSSHESGKRDESHRIWALLGLEVWNRAFLVTHRPQRSHP